MKMAEKEENDAMNGDVEEDVAEVCRSVLVLLGITTNVCIVISTCLIRMLSPSRRWRLSVRNRIKCSSFHFTYPNPIASVVLFGSVEGKE